MQKAFYDNNHVGSKHVLLKYSEKLITLTILNKGKMSTMLCSVNGVRWLTNVEYNYNNITTHEGLFKNNILTITAHQWLIACMGTAVELYTIGKIDLY